MDADSETNSSFSSSTHPLNVDIVVEQILSYFGKYAKDLIKYRLVCHKWNDTVVRKLKDRSFKIPLRYEPHVPKVIDISSGRRGAVEVLDTAISTLTGTAARLHFNTVIIDRDFYLAGVIPQFEKFLEIQGESIRHLKIKIRPEKHPKENENHVLDCAEVVSMDILRTIFSATPNLKSLNFCVRFSHYKDMNKNVEKRCMYPATSTLPPQLKQLTRIKIQEPVGVQYSIGLLKTLISLPSSPSNLKSLKFKPTIQLSNFAHAINDMEPRVKRSLRKLDITRAWIDTPYSLQTGIVTLNLRWLRTLILNKISGHGKYSWIRSVLRACHSNLQKLFLGEEKSNEGEGQDWNVVDLEIGDEGSLFPPVMAKLGHLEINFTEFNVREHVRVISYGTQFPRLKTLRLTAYLGERWTLNKFDHMLPGTGGESQTLKNFYLSGGIDGEEEERSIVRVAYGTFPNVDTAM